MMSGKSYYYMNELWRRQTLLTWCRRVLAVMNPLENDMTTELETMLGCELHHGQSTNETTTNLPAQHALVRKYGESIQLYVRQ
jgi:hypothetical protein